MNENEKCKCPMCDQEFAPESGLTAKEHLAKGIVRIYREMQDVQHTHELPCPRCGHMIMRPVLEENAFSCYIDVYVCSECGIDEALRDMRKDPVPLSAWSIVCDILKSLRGVRCKYYIPEKGSFYTLYDNPVCEESATCNISAHMADEGGYSRYDK